MYLRSVPGRSVGHVSEAEVCGGQMGGATVLEGSATAERAQVAGFEQGCARLLLLGHYGCETPETARLSLWLLLGCSQLASPQSRYVAPGDTVAAGLGAGLLEALVPLRWGTDGTRVDLGYGVPQMKTPVTGEDRIL